MVGVDGNHGRTGAGCDVTVIAAVAADIHDKARAHPLEEIRNESLFHLLGIPIVCASGSVVVPGSLNFESGHQARDLSLQALEIEHLRRRILALRVVRGSRGALFAAVAFLEHVRQHDIQQVGRIQFREPREVLRDLTHRNPVDVREEVRPEVPSLRTAEHERIYKVPLELSQRIPNIQTRRPADRRQIDEDGLTLYKLDIISRRVLQREPLHYQATLDFESRLGG